MKTIVETATGLSKYVFEENDLDRKVKELEDTLDRVRERLIKLEKPQ